MSSFHDEISSEINAARKLAADFANRYRRNPVNPPPLPSGPERLAQEEAAAAEIAALAAEEALLASEARVRAEQRAKAREAENANAKGERQVTETAQPGSIWNAKAILKGLAKLRAKERTAAEELIRKAHEIEGEDPLGANDLPPEGQELHPPQPAAPVRAMWAPSLGETQVWYFTNQGTRCGPVTFGELRAMAASRVLDPRLDMVWKEGMEGWKKAGLLDGLFERRPVPIEPTPTSSAKKPKTVAALPTDLTAALASKHVHWPGAGRRSLWFGLLLFPVLWSQLLWWSYPALASTFGSGLISRLLPFANWLPVAVLIHLVLRRLVNLGMSRWWAFILVVPILNLWVAFRCLACPAGYAHHRKMDRAGMAIALSMLIILPAVGSIYLKHPELVSQEHLRGALSRLIDEAGKLLIPR